MKRYVCVDCGLNVKQGTELCPSCGDVIQIVEPKPKKSKGFRFNFGSKILLILIGSCSVVFALLIAAGALNFGEREPLDPIVGAWDYAFLEHIDAYGVSQGTIFVGRLELYHDRTGVVTDDSGRSENIVWAQYDGRLMIADRWQSQVFSYEIIGTTLRKIAQIGSERVIYTLTKVG